MLGNFGNRDSLLFSMIEFFFLLSGLKKYNFDGASEIDTKGASESQR